MENPPIFPGKYHQPGGYSIAILVCWTLLGDLHKWNPLQPELHLQMVHVSFLCLLPRVLYVYRQHWNWKGMHDTAQNHDKKNIPHKSRPISLPFKHIIRVRGCQGWLRKDFFQNSTPAACGFQACKPAAQNLVANCNIGYFSSDDPRLLFKHIQVSKYITLSGLKKKQLCFQEICSHNVVSLGCSELMDISAKDALISECNQ